MELSDSINVERVDKEYAYIIQNMFPYYLHDLSEFFFDSLPNSHGLYENEDVKIYKKEDFLMHWWNEDDLMPNLIKFNSIPVGFAMLAKKPYTKDFDFAIEEFFILKQFRKKGIGEYVARKMLTENRGKWRLDVLEKNYQAQNFWRKVLIKGGYKDILEQSVEEESLEEYTEKMMRFTFTSI